MFETSTMLVKLLCVCPGLPICGREYHITAWSRGEPYSNSAPANAATSPSPVASITTFPSEPAARVRSHDYSTNSVACDDRSNNQCLQQHICARLLGLLGKRLVLGLDVPTSDEAIRLGYRT